MKNKNLLVAVVIILLLLGGGAFYFLGQSHKNQTVDQSANKQASQNEMQKQSTEKKSLKDFLTMSGSQSLQCTFSDKTTNSSGTVFVDNNKMRGDFTASLDGKEMQSHMINDGSYVYSWTDGQKEGYKMSLATIKNAASENGTPAPKTPGQAVDMQKQVNYSCSPWSVDTTKFALPQGISFNDFSEMMKGMPQGGPSSSVMQGNQAACGQCDQIPAGTAREQCKAALKCN